MNQDFKDRVANLLIDARVNAVLAEAEDKPEDKPEAKPNGQTPDERVTRNQAAQRAFRHAEEMLHLRKHGGSKPKPVKESTKNQDLKDRLINIIMEKMEKKVGDLGQRNAAAATAKRLKAGGEGNAVAKNYVKEFKAKAKVETNSSKPIGEGKRSRALAGATDPKNKNTLQATSDNARFNAALKNNKAGNVALNQMLGVGKDTNGVDKNTKGVGKNTKGVGKNTKGVGKDTKGVGKNTKKS